MVRVGKLVLKATALDDLDEAPLREIYVDVLNNESAAQDAMKAIKKRLLDKREKTNLLGFMAIENLVDNCGKKIYKEAVREDFGNIMIDFASQSHRPLAQLMALSLIQKWGEKYRENAFMDPEQVYPNVLIQLRSRGYFKVLEEHAVKEELKEEIVWMAEVVRELDDILARINPAEEDVASDPDCSELHRMCEMMMPRVLHLIESVEDVSLLNTLCAVREELAAVLQEYEEKRRRTEMIIEQLRRECEEMEREMQSKIKKSNKKNRDKLMQLQQEVADVLEDTDHGLEDNLDALSASAEKPEDIEIAKALAEVVVKDSKEKRGKGSKSDSSDTESSARVQELLDTLAKKDREIGELKKRVRALEGKAGEVETNAKESVRRQSILIQKAQADFATIDEDDSKSMTPENFKKMKKELAARNAQIELLRQEKEEAVKKEHEKVAETVRSLQAALKQTQEELQQAQKGVGDASADKRVAAIKRWNMVISTVHKRLDDREKQKLEDRLKAKEAEATEATNKYLKEMRERRKLHNQIQELKGNIRVFIRLRPANRFERENHPITIVKRGNIEGELIQLDEVGEKKKNTLEFDYVFTPESTQEDVFRETAPTITSVVDGFNACIFAYGQSGSGKTHTMEGTPDNKGINYRALEELFRITQERADTFEFTLKASLFEIYNEEIRDLLRDSKKNITKLEIRQHPKLGHFIQDLTQREVSSTGDVLKLIEDAHANRSVGVTNLNEHSSRSHMVAQIVMESKNRLDGSVRYGKLNLCDLAGSERVSKTDATGDRLREAQSINKSLMMLGEVIGALSKAQRGGDSAHVPYRNTKLTHCLADSLGDGAKVLMFAMMGPSNFNWTETDSTLKFATKVKAVELGPSKRNKANDLKRLKSVKEKLGQAKNMK